MIKEQLKSESFEAKASMGIGALNTYNTIKNAQGVIIDYQDVEIEGYASTFDLDRGNDQILKGAYIEFLPEYLENPTLLSDHVRECFYNSGGIKFAFEDEKGLKINGKLSNSPSERMVDLRFKVVEGFIKTLSVAGMFHIVGQSGGRNLINKVEPREISLVVVPMNKDSLFEVKADDKPIENKLDESQESEKMASGDQQADQTVEKSDLYINIKNEKYKYKE